MSKYSSNGQERYSYEYDVETPRSDYNATNPYLDDNLDLDLDLDAVLDFNDAIFNRIEPIVIDAMPPIYEPTIQTQAVMKTPYYKLEIVGVVILSILTSSTSFLFAGMRKYFITTDLLIQYLVIRFLHFLAIGMVMFLFSNTDTYKSLNLTTDILCINAIIYSYNSITVLKYILIHIFGALTGSLFTYGMYYYVVDSINTDDLLGSIFLRRRDYSFNTSRIMISIMVHIILSSGLTILINTTNTINIRDRVINKISYIFAISIIFGIFIGPIGYIWYNLSLYIVIVLLRSDGFEVLNINILFNYLAMILSIIFIFPIVAVQIKFNLWNKYRNYIEYKK